MSRGALLDNAAIEALKQWRYSPLVFRGHPDETCADRDIQIHDQLIVSAPTPQFSRS
jgi:hypothetical protein